MKKIFMAMSLVLMLPVVAAAQTEKSPIRVSPQDEAIALQEVKKMPMRNRITQLIMPVVKMFDMDSARILIDKYVGEYKVGGILFYKGKCSEQIELYNRAVSKSDYPIFVAIDGEWGLNMRLQNTPRFPVNMALGAINDPKLLEEYGAEMGRQCKRMGININFAPVLDVNSNPQNPVIGRRAFSDDKMKVTQMGVAYAIGLEKAGVLSCAKHFPGHGDTSQDSHKTLPTVYRSKDAIYDIDLYPFRKYIEAGLNGMMVAHLRVPAIDSISGVSCSLSPVVVTDILRNQMSFSGLVFTDALDMKGVTKYTDVAVKALLAGNDILVMPVDFDKCVEEITAAIADGRIPESLINQRCAKVIAYKRALSLNLNVVESNNVLSDLDTEYCRSLIAKLAQKSITLVRDKNKLLKRFNARKSQLITLGDDENLKMLSLGDTVVTGREFYRYIDKSYLHYINYNSKSQGLPKIGYSVPTVVEVFSAKPKYIEALQEIAKHPNVTIIFYVHPYEMLRFKDAVTAENAIVCAYEDTFDAQRAAQNAIQGKSRFEGVMPVKIEF